MSVLIDLFPGLPDPCTKEHAVEAIHVSERTLNRWIANGDLSRLHTRVAPRTDPQRGPDRTGPPRRGRLMTTPDPWADVREQLTDPSPEADRRQRTHRAAAGGARCAHLTRSRPRRGTGGGSDKQPASRIVVSESTRGPSMRRPTFARAAQAARLRATRDRIVLCGDHTGTSPSQRVDGIDAPRRQPPTEPHERRGLSGSG